MTDWYVVCIIKTQRRDFFQKKVSHWKKHWLLWRYSPYNAAQKLLWLLKANEKVFAMVSVH